MNKTSNISLWILQVLLAAAFVMAGMSKLSGQEMMVENFEKIGLGQGLRYLTGIIEVVSAILLLTHRSSFIGAGLLVCTMIGAALAHFTTLGGSAVPAIVLGCMAAIVAYGRRPASIKLDATANRPEPSWTAPSSKIA